MRMAELLTGSKSPVPLYQASRPSVPLIFSHPTVQLALFDPETRHVHRFVRGEFVLYAPHQRRIPTVGSSKEWYGGHREHLGFASIVSPQDGKHREEL